MSTKLRSTVCMKCYPTTVTHNEVRKGEHYSWTGVVHFPNTFSGASLENPNEQNENITPELVSFIFQTHFPVLVLKTLTSKLKHSPTIKQKGRWFSWQKLDVTKGN